MLQQTRAIQVMVLQSVNEGAAYRGIGQRLVVRVLPSHGQWRQIPVMPAWHAGAVRITFLMTRRAVQRRDAFAFRTTHDIGKVTPAIVALLRIICRRMTIDASRMR